jgi:predicted Zn-dependent protease with MMP-like domain
VYQVRYARFEALVRQALDTLPEELARHVDNVAIIVEYRHRSRALFGLYEGIPLTRRSPLNYVGVMPDRITLYYEPICAVSHSEEQLVEQIRRTVIHEIAHHFGISDPRLDELGWS